jgi:carboxymethylenebutenolidase
MTLLDEGLAEVLTPTGPMRTHLFSPSSGGPYPGVLLYSEIFQITGPIRRIAAQLASQGFLVAAPEIYHELEVPGTVLGYDAGGSGRGNNHKITKELSSFDSDAQAALRYLAALPGCSGRLGVMGVCIGGHLAFRAATNPQVLATACFYATDLHTRSLGKGKNDNSLERASEIKGELLMVWGRQDPHIPLEGRRQIHARLEEAGVGFQWLEVNAAHAFLRDEGPRYDASLARHCYGLVFDLFHRRLCQ